MYIKKLIQKNKNGKERIYLQLVKSYREGEKVKQKLIANIGRLDELLENGDIETFITNLSRILEEEKGKYYVDVTNELSCEDVFEYGMPYLISALWNRTGLKKILIQEFEKLKGKDRAEREVEAIFEMVLVGGTGSRLKPLTKVTNKHLLPVGKYPMIYYPIYRLKQAGITEILVVTGRDHMGDVMELLGSGKDYGVEFAYKVQDQAGGIAEALGLARNFVNGDRCAVILGDNIFEDNITPDVESFAKQECGAKILLKEVSNPQRFGVAELKDGKIVSIEEKPKQPKSNFAVTGIYMYDSDVFETTKTLKPSARGELEITDVNNTYIHRGTLTYDILKGWWTDAGTPESLFRANELCKDLELYFGNG